jgi:hypothetical protein
MSTKILHIVQGCIMTQIAEFYRKWHLRLAHLRSKHKSGRRIMLGRGKKLKASG